MKQIETIAKGQNFEAVNIGSWDEVIGYELPMGPNVLHGKVFVGQAVGTTGSELSFQTLAPGQDSGFLHTHKTHEELYIIITCIARWQASLEEQWQGEHDDVVHPIQGQCFRRGRQPQGGRQYPPGTS